MVLKELSLVDFKNFEEADLSLSPDVNCFVGANGAGKTNLLDSVHYLSLSKSYFNSVDSQNIREGRSFFVIQGKFEHEGREDVLYCSMERNKKKRFKRNQKEYDRLADHIGKYPVVLISPFDQALIREGSDRRRRFMDGIISQYDQVYLHDLIKYNRALSQRNALLKQFQKEGRWDSDSIGVWDDQLIDTGTRIHEKRNSFIGAFGQAFHSHFTRISGGDESVSMEYGSPLLEGELGKLLKGHAEKDRVLGYTTVGIHKEDLEFRINGRPLKKFGSQGQQKSFLLALKLAKFDFVKAALGVKPILLLDDIFDKLDKDRVRSLMKLVAEDAFGQILVSDTGKERLDDAFQGLDKDIRFFNVEKGQVWEETPMKTP